MGKEIKIIPPGGAFVVTDYVSPSLTRLVERGGWILPSHFSTRAKKVVASATLVFFFAFTILPQALLAAPVIENIQGDGTIDQQVSDNVTNITVAGNLTATTTNADQLASEIWNVYFTNPTDSFMLHVFDSTGTQLLGTINIHNGLFALLNSAGIEIGSTAAINVFDGGFIASALGSLNADVMNGKYVFKTEDGTNGFVLNQGKITGTNGSFAALLGKAVENTGEMKMPLGKVALAGGNEVALGISGNNDLISVVVDEAVTSPVFKDDAQVKDQIKNTGTIQADGGQVIVNAQAVNDVFDHSVNLEGHVQANEAVMGQDGSIEIVASDDVRSNAMVEALNGQVNIESQKGAVTNAGTLNVSDGKLHIQAEGAIKNEGTLRAGEFREEGYTFKSTGTLAAMNAYFHNIDRAAYLSGTVAGGTYNDELFYFDGDTTFTGAVTLNATDSIGIDGVGGWVIALGGDTIFNADSDAIGSGGVYLSYGSTQVVGNGYDLTLNSSSDDNQLGIISNVGLLTLGTNKQELVDLIFHSGSTVDDIDVVTFKTENGVMFSKTVGDGSSNNPYLIYDITQLQNMNNNLSSHYTLANNIDASATADWNGGLGFMPVGTTAEWTQAPTNPFTGSFDGNDYTISGLYINRPNEEAVGLFGAVDMGANQIQDVTVSVEYIRGYDIVGGLVGLLMSGTISGATAIVAAGKTVTTDNVAIAGGLVGNNYGGHIIKSRALIDGAVSASYGAGGLVGAMWDYNANGNASIENSYAEIAAGAVISGGIYAGGLLATNQNGEVFDSYSRVNGTINAGAKGGLVGSNQADGVINDSFTTGSSADSLYGGNIGEINNSFYDSDETVFYNASHDVYTAGTPWDFTVDGVAAGSGDWIMAGLPHLQSEWTTNITNVYQLQMMQLNLGADYVLVNDIDATETVNWNGGLGFNPVGLNVEDYPEYAFTGNFDGNSKTITGLTIHRPDEYGPAGLFMNTYFATIQNVGLIDADITGRNLVGGLVGYGISTSISNSYVSGNVSGNSYVGGVAGLIQSSDVSGVFTDVSVSAAILDGGYGGLIGRADNSTIMNAYALGSVVGGADTTGGLIGESNASDISNSYAAGSVTGNNRVGGLVGGRANGAVSNSYALGTVSGSSNVGGLIGYNFGNVENSYYVDDNHGNQDGKGVAASLSDFYGTGSGTGGAVYSGWTFGDGNGGWDSFSNGLPHLDFEWSTNVTTLLQLQNMKLNLNTSYYLMNDIDASATRYWNWDSGSNSYLGFDPVGDVGNEFTAFFGDGDYGAGSPRFTITGLYINRPTEDYVGLFGATSEAASMAEFDLVNADITGNNYVGAAAGAFAGHFYSPGFYRISSSGEVNGNNYTGGLIGQNTGGMTDSFSTAAVTGLGHDVGGLVGSNTSGLYNSHYSGTVNGQYNVGGIAGSNSGTILQSYSSGSVIGGAGPSDYSYAGGLVGENTGNIFDSYSSSTVDGLYVVGGLVGINNGSIYRAYASGNVTATYSNAGGLVGTNNNGTITDSFATGTVSGEYFVGGLVGLNAGAVNNSYFVDNSHGDQSGRGTVTTRAALKGEGHTHDVYANWDFNTMWQAFDTTFPHFQYESFTPPAVAGIVISGLLSWWSGVTGINMGLSIDGGAPAISVEIGADGSFSFSNVEIADGQSILLIVNDFNYAANFFGIVQNSPTEITGLDFEAGKLTLGSATIAALGTGITTSVLPSITGFDGTLFSGGGEAVTAYADVVANVGFSGTFDMNGHTLNMQANTADNLTLNGSGVIQMNGQSITGGTTLTISDGATYSMSGGATIYGNMVQNGTLSGDAIYLDGSWSGTGTTSNDISLTGQINSGTFSGAVSNSSYINGGTFTSSGSVTNTGTINGGSFEGSVTNNGLIYDSAGMSWSPSGLLTFSGDVTNNDRIYGALFTETSTIDNYGIVWDEFGMVSHGIINNLTGGTLRSGTFNGYVDNTTGIIYGGTFNGNVTSTGMSHGSIVREDGCNGCNTLLFNGTVTNQDLTINNGTFNGNDVFVGDSGVFNGNVLNYGTIAGGTYNTGTVTNALPGAGYSAISDGTFNGTVENTAGTLSGGTFNGTVNNHMFISGGNYTGVVNVLDGSNISGMNATAGELNIQTTSDVSMGSNTLNDFNITTPGAHVYFDANSTQTINGNLTVAGTDGNLASLGLNAASGTPGVDRWNINVAGTANVDYANISDSNNAGADITATHSFDGGNNSTSWLFGGIAGITISGTLEWLAGATGYLRLMLNSGLSQNVNVDSNGHYEFTNVAVENGDLLQIYYNGDGMMIPSSEYLGSFVGKIQNSPTVIENLSFGQGVLTIGSASINELGAAVSAADFPMMGATGAMLFSTASSVVSAAANVVTNVAISGTFNMWDMTGPHTLSLNADAGDVALQGQGFIDANNHSFNALNIQGQYTLSDDLIVTNDLNVESVWMASLDAQSTYAITEGGDWGSSYSAPNITNLGAVTLTGGDGMMAKSIFGMNQMDAFNDLTVSGHYSSYGVNVNGNLTVTETGNFLTSTNENLNVGGDFTNSGTISNFTILLTGSGAIHSVSSLENLNIQGSYSLTHDLTVTNDLILTGMGSLDAQSTYAITEGGDWGDMGIAPTISNLGLVTLTGGDAMMMSPKYIYGANTFNDLTINGYYRLNDSDQTVTGSLTIGTGATLDAGGTPGFGGDHDITVSRDWINQGGIFWAHDGSVIFNDAMQVSHISGDTRFYNFTSVTPGKHFEFSGGSTQGIAGTLTLTGTEGNEIVLNSSDGMMNRFNLAVASDQTVSFVDVSNSNVTNSIMLMSSGNITAEHSISTYGNNDDTEDPMMNGPQWIFGGMGILIRGIVSGLTGGTSIYLVIEGQDVANAGVSDADGSFSFSNVAATAGQKILLYLYDSMMMNNDHANWVGISNGSGDITGITVTVGGVTIGTSGTVNGGHFANEDFTTNYMDSSKLLYSNGMNGFTISTYMSSDPADLYIAPGVTYEPHGNINISGSFIEQTDGMGGNRGAFDSTSIYDVTLTGSGVIDVASTFNNLNIQGAYSLNHDLVAQGDLSVTNGMMQNGSLDVQSHTITEGGDWGDSMNGASNITNLGDVILKGWNKNIYGNNTFGNLTLDFSSYTLNAAQNITGNLSIDHGATLNAGGMMGMGGYDLTVGGDWYSQGSFTANGGTVTFQGSGKTITTYTMNGNAFGNLTFDSGSDYNITDGLTVNGNMTQNGTLSGAAITNGGTWSGTGTTSNNVTNNGMISRGTFSADVTNTSGASIVGGAFGSIYNENGGSIYDVLGLTVSGIVNNYGEISGGTFSGNVNNYNTITTPGNITYGYPTFTGDVVNSGTISGGTFSQQVDNLEGVINGGFFDGVVHNFSTISNGSFSAFVQSESDGAISGGAFGGYVINYGAISGGTFNDSVWSGGTINGGTFAVGGSVANNGSIYGDNNPEFYGSVTNDLGIYGGTFSGNVTNNNNIEGGIFSGEVTNSSGNGIIHDGTFTAEGSVINNGYIESYGGYHAVFDGTVTNNNYIYGGTYSGTVYDNGGTISGMNFTGGTINFQGASATIVNGDNTFNDVNITTAGKIVDFAAGSTQTVNGVLTVNGQAEGTEVSLEGAGEWFLNVVNPGSAVVDYAIVTNSNASGGIQIDATHSSGEGTTNWNFISAGFTIAGYLYDMLGGSVVDNEQVVLVVNGQQVGNAVTTHDGGQYSFDSISFSYGDGILVYVTGNNSLKANTVTVGGTSDIVNLNLYGNTVTVSVAATNPDMSTALGAVSDAGILYGVDGGSVLSVNDGADLHIESGATFNPDADMNLSGGLINEGNLITSGIVANFTGTGHIQSNSNTFNSINISGDYTLNDDLAATDLNNSGTLDLGTNGLAVGGNYVNSGTLRLENNDVGNVSGVDASQGTIEYTGNNRQSGLKLGNSYENLTLSGYANYYKLDSDLVVTGNLNNTNSNLNLDGHGVAMSSDSTVTNGGAFQVIGTENLENFHYNGDGRVDYTRNDGAIVTELLLGNTYGTVTFSGDANYDLDGTLTANYLNNDATSFVHHGDVILSMTGTTGLSSNNAIFNNLELNGEGNIFITDLQVENNLTMSGGSWIGSGTFDVGNLAINADTEFSAPSTINVTGNWTNNGTFTHNDGIVNFTGGEGVTQLLNSGGVLDGQKFSTLNHTGAGTLQLVGHAVNAVANVNNSNGVFDLNNARVYTAGVFDSTGGTLAASNGGVSIWADGGIILPSIEINGAIELVSDGNIAVGGNLTSNDQGVFVEVNSTGNGSITIGGDVNAAADISLLAGLAADNDVSVGGSVTSGGIADFDAGRDVNVTGDIAAEDIYVGYGDVDHFRANNLSASNGTIYASIANGVEIASVQAGNLTLQGGGTISIGETAGSLTLNGNFALSDALDVHGLAITGSLDANSNTITNSSNWTNLLANITHLGAVIFSGTGSITESGSFNGVTITGTRNLGSNLAASSLAFSGGTLDVNSRAITTGGDWTNLISGNKVTELGAVTLTGAGAITETGTFNALTLTGARTLGANLATAGNLDFHTGSITGNGHSTTTAGNINLGAVSGSDVNLTGTNKTITSNGNSFEGLNVSGSYTAQDATVAGTVNNSGTLDIANKDLTANTSFTNTGTLKLVGTQNISGVAVSPTQGTVEYTGSGSYTGLALGDEYYNLKFSGTGTYQTDADLDVNNNLILSNASGVLSIRGHGLDVAGAFSNDGTLRLNGDENVALTMDTNSGTIDYADSVNHTGLLLGNSYYNVSFSGSGTYTLDSALTAAGDLTVTGHLDAANKTISEGGNWTVNQFANTNNLGAVILTGANKTIASDGIDDTFGDLTISGTYTLASGIKVANGLTVSGSGNSLSLSSYNADVEGDVIFSNAGAINGNSGSMNVAGRWLRSAGTFNAGSSTVTFDGSGLQTILSGNFYNLVNQTSGTLQTTGAVLSVSHDLTQTSGIFDPNGYGMTVNGTAYINGGTLNPLAGSNTFGTLTINNDMDVNASAANMAIGSLNINSTAGFIAPSATKTFTLSGNLVKASGATFDANGGTLTLNGGSQGIYGNNTFYNLIKSNSTSPTLTFEAGSTQTIQHSLTLSGTAGHELNLRSSSTGSYWNLDLQGSSSATYLNVKDSNNIGTAISAVSSTDAGHNSGWSFLAAQLFTWLGSVSTDWFTGANWNLGSAPNASNADVLIVAGTTYQPTLTNSVTVNNLTIETDAILTLGDKGLTVGATLSNNGTIKLQGTSAQIGNISIANGNDTNSGTWEYIGTGDGSALTIKDFGSGNDYYNLILNSTSGSKNNFALSSNLNVVGALTVSGSNQFSTGSSNVTAASTALSSGTWNAGSGTHNLGSLSISNDADFNTDTSHLTTSGITLTGNGSTFTAGAQSVDVNGSVTIGANTIFTAPSATMTISGNFSNSGTFNHNSGNIVLDGAGQSISGSSTFNNLSKQTGSSLTFGESTTQTVLGLLTLKGTSGNRMTLQSSSIVGVRWNVNAANTDIAFVRVQDSRNTGASISAASSQDLGNNVGWSFGANLLTWLGYSSDWLDVNNWDQGFVPLSTDSVIIADTAHDPILTQALTVVNLTINSGAVLDLNGQDITVSNIFSNEGTMRLIGTESNISLVNDTNSGIWEYVGNGLGTTITIKDFGNGNDYYDLTLNSTSGSKNAFSLGANLNVAHTLTMSGMTEFSSNGKTVTASSAVLNDGIYRSSTATQSFTNFAVSSGGTLQLNSGTFTVSNNFDLSSGATVNLGGGNLNISGNLSVADGVTMDASGAASMTISGSLTQTGGTFIAPTLLNVAGSWITTSDSTFTAGTGTVTFTGSGNHTLVSNGQIFHNLSQTGTGTLQLADAMTVANSLSIGSGSTVDLNGRALTMTGATFTNSGTLQLQGGEAFTNFTNPLTLSNMGTWKYVGSGSTAMHITSTGQPTQYYNLIFAANDANAAFDINSDITVGNTFSLTSGSFDANGRAVTATGATTVSGGTYQAGSGTQAFNGGLTLNGGTFTGSTGTVDVTNMTLSSGTLNAPTGDFLVSGNWAKNGGTLNIGTGTVTFDGAGTQTVNQGDTAFNNLTHSGAGTMQVSTNDLSVVGALQNTAGTFDANGRAVTIAGATTVSGGTYNAAGGTQTLSGGLNVNGGTFNSSTSTVDTTDVALSSGTLNGNSGNFLVAGNWANTGGTFSSGSSSVTFDKAAGTQTVNAGTSAFNNVIHAGAGTLQVSANDLATNALTNSNGTFDANGRAVTAAGLATVSGGTYNAGTGTQTLNGGLTVNGGTYAAGAGETEVNGTYTQSSGTFTGSTGDVDVNGNFDLTGGNFTAPVDGNVDDDDFTIAGNFNIGDGSNFNANGGKVTLDSSNTATIDAPNGELQFWDFSILANNKIVQFRAGDLFTVLSPHTWVAQGTGLTLTTTDPGTHWQINAADPVGGVDLNGFTVSWSENVSGANISCPTCYDGGNNINWSDLLAIGGGDDEPPTVDLNPTCPGPDCPEGGSEVETGSSAQVDVNDFIEVSTDDECTSGDAALRNPACREKVRSKVSVYEGSVYLFCPDANGNEQICGVSEAGDKVEIEWLATPNQLQTMDSEERAMGHQLYEEMRLKKPVVSAAVPAASLSAVRTPVESQLKVNESELQRFAKIHKVQGDVMVRHSGHAEWVPAYSGLILSENDEIRTGKGAKVEVHLDHDAETGKFYLYDNSLLRLATLNRDGVSQDKNTVLDLALGRVITRAEKLQGQSKFRIRTPTVVAGVRGTVFEVAVDGTITESAEPNMDK